MELPSKDCELYFVGVPVQRDRSSLTRQISKTPVADGIAVTRATPPIQLHRWLSAAFQEFIQRKSFEDKMRLAPFVNEPDMRGIDAGHTGVAIAATCVQ